MQVQKEGQNPYEGSLEIKQLYHTPLKAFDMSRPTAKISPKSLKENDQYAVKKQENHQYTGLSGNHTDNQREGCKLIDASLSSY